MKNYNNLRIYIPTVLAVVWIIASLVACEKETDDASPIDANTIKNVVADNFNLAIMNAALNRGGLANVVKENGSFTLLAPSDDAFNHAGYLSTTAMLTETTARAASITNYLLLDGNYELNKLPYIFNQELQSRGGKLYATHWIKGQDTVLTINGARLLAQNVPASNGLIQVINRMLEPYVHEKLGDALAADQDITLFAQALISSGLMETINANGPYTIFAPTNEAVKSFGYASINEIAQADPQELRRWVSYHIVRDRRFVYDYILSAGSTNTSKQAMLDGNTVTVNLMADESDPSGFGGISLRGTGNTTEVSLLKQDFLTGNGVLHVVDNVLKITQ